MIVIVLVSLLILLLCIRIAYDANKIKSLELKNTELIAENQALGKIIAELNRDLEKLNHQSGTARILELKKKAQDYVERIKVGKSSGSPT